MGSEAWKKIPNAEKEKYEKIYQKAKTQYDEDMAAFLAAGGQKEKGAVAQRSERRKEREGTLKKKKDPNQPKRPGAGAFGIFIAENREKISKSLPPGVRCVEVTKVGAKQWAELSAVAKKPYEDKFLKKKEEYEAAMIEYKKNLPEDAEDDEEDDQGEEEEEEEPSEPVPKRGRKAGA